VAEKGKTFFSEKKKKPLIQGKGRAERKKKMENKKERGRGSEGPCQWGPEKESPALWG